MKEVFRLVGEHFSVVGYKVEVPSLPSTYLIYDGAVPTWSIFTAEGFALAKAMYEDVFKKDNIEKFGIDIGNAAELMILDDRWPRIREKSAEELYNAITESLTSCGSDKPGAPEEGASWASVVSFTYELLGVKDV